MCDSEVWMLCGTREPGRDGLKSTGLSALLDMASEQLVDRPWETSYDREGFLLDSAQVSMG